MSVEQKNILTIGAAAVAGALGTWALMRAGSPVEEKKQDAKRGNPKQKGPAKWKRADKAPAPSDGTCDAMAAYEPLKTPNFKPWRMPLTPYFTGDDHVEMKVTHCGVCHSDLHTVNGDWSNNVWPIAPGHEVVGICTKVGKNVKHIKVGDRIATGPQAFSCNKCHYCTHENAQYCDAGWRECFGTKLPDGSFTMGGYAGYHRSVGTHTHLVPDNLSSAGAAPLLCAGVTTFVPLRNADVKGKKVAVVGVGGLGHLAVRFASAMGAHVTCITRSPGKEALFKSLGAHDTLIVKADADYKVARRRFDVVLNTISSTAINLDALLGIVAPLGTFINVGAGPGKLGLTPGTVNMKGLKVVGHLVGSPENTRDMLDFCSEHGIEAMVEVLPVSKVNEAMDKVEKSTAHFRMVLVHPGHENDA